MCYFSPRKTLPRFVPSDTEASRQPRVTLPFSTRPRPWTEGPEGQAAGRHVGTCWAEAGQRVRGREAGVGLWLKRAAGCGRGGASWASTGMKTTLAAIGTSRHAQHASRPSSTPQFAQHAHLALNLPRQTAGQAGFPRTGRDSLRSSLGTKGQGPGTAVSMQVSPTGQERECSPWGPHL